MRRMDSAEKRKRCCNDESDWVIEEDYFEDSDPCKSICSGEERCACVSEDDVFLCMLLSVSLRPKKMGEFHSRPPTWFRAPTGFALRDVESNVE